MITVSNFGTLQFNSSDAFGSNASTTIGACIIVNAGGLVINSGSDTNTLGQLFLNGGTITGTGGLSATSQAFYLHQTITVGGSSASTISNTRTNSGFNLVSIGAFSTSPRSPATRISIYSSTAPRLIPQPALPPDLPKPGWEPWP